MITIKLIFSGYFQEMLGIEHLSLTLPRQTSLKDALEIFLKKYPDYCNTLKNRNCILLGEVKALFTVNGQMITSSHLLSDGEDILLRQAFIGG